MTVRSDSKGRLTGAKPEERYVRTESPDGTITYVPETPKRFDDIQDVTEEQFEQVFGVNPAYMSAEDMRVHNDVRTEGDTYYPNGFVITRFAIGDDGGRIFRDQSNNAVKLTTLVRIKKTKV